MQPTAYSPLHTLMPGGQLQIEILAWNAAMESTELMQRSREPGDTDIASRPPSASSDFLQFRTVPLACFPLSAFRSLPSVGQLTPSMLHLADPLFWCASVYEGPLRSVRCFQISRAILSPKNGPGKRTELRGLLLTGPFFKGVPKTRKCSGSEGPGEPSYGHRFCAC